MKEHKIITEFEAAVRDHAYMGARDPRDHEEIQNAYDEAKSVLVTRINRFQARIRTLNETLKESQQ